MRIFINKKLYDEFCLGIKIKTFYSSPEIHVPQYRVGEVGWNHYRV